MISVAVGEEVTQCIVRGTLPQIDRDVASVPAFDEHPSGHRSPKLTLRLLPQPDPKSDASVSQRNESSDGDTARRRRMWILSFGARVITPSQRL